MAMRKQQAKNFMETNEYTMFPALSLLGNAGSMSPGEKEQRYKPFIEKLHLNNSALECDDEQYIK